MNKLTNLRKFVFASIITLFGVISNAQTLSPQDPAMAPETYGTEANPYLITSAADWETFTDNKVTGVDYWASGVCVKLMDNIPNAADIENKIYSVSTMAGTSGNKYQGTFDGNWHTLTFNKGTEASRFNANYCAPFRYISAATIKNLTVEGTIISNKKFVSGLAASVTGGNCYITNCTSSIHILCNYIDSKDGDCTHGGFVGREESTGDDIIFENCLFDGWIKDTNATKKAIKCAGFVAWAQGKVHYTSCYMVGEIDIKELVANFHRNGANPFNNPYEYENFRYLTDYSDGIKHGPEGHKVIHDLAHLSKKYVTDQDYYVPCTIRGLEYIEYNKDNPVTLTPEVYYFSKKLVKGVDYTVVVEIKDDNGDYITLDPPIIQQAGDYKVTITGTGSVYFGSDAVYFSIIGEGQKWSDLQALIDAAPNNGTIELTRDYVATSKDAGALQINKNITIDLKGHTINRNLSEAQENGRVIEIASGFNVTIKDGTITGGYKVAKNEAPNSADNDGGGIYNLGYLTLTDVTVTGNKCIKKVADGSYTGRGGGIYCGNSGSFTMNGGEISKNVAEGGGGGIFVDKTPNMVMNDVTVSSNTTKDKGAGMRLAIPASTIYNIVGCTFSMNSATDKANSEGGAIYFLGINETSSVLNLNYCGFTYNSAYSKGGAIFSYSGTTIATGCNMQDNLAFDAVGVVDEKSKGGSLYLQKSKDGTSKYTMDGGSITYSGALDSGGAVFVEDGAVFNVKGTVEIKGCSKYNDETNIDNNVFLDGSENVIHVVGRLDSESIIYVTKTGGGSIMDGNSDYWSLSNFTFDDDNYRVKIDDGKVELYRPYSWTDDPSDWDGYIVKDGENYTIKAAITIPDECIATPTSITFASDPNTTGGELIIEDGGQLVYGTSIPVTIKKNISKATTDENGWYTISSAVHDDDKTYVLLSNIKSIIENSLNDMYLYDEAESYWRNRRTSGAGFDSIARGRGYLYRNGVDVTVSYVGKTNVGTLNDYTLSCQANNDLRGFNLVGNPYSHNIYKGVAFATTTDTLATGYYMLSDDGSWQPKTNADAIGVNQGVLVQATASAHGKLLQFKDKTEAPAAKNAERNIMFTIKNAEYSDVAYAMLEEKVGLNKISHRNPEIPMLYISDDNKDYAIATMSDDVKAFDLNFEAKTFGRYTLSVKPQGYYGYLHLYDKLAAKDIDLLKESEYEFVGSTADGADRFVVRLDPSTPSTGSGTEVFVWQSGNDIIVDGNGELQVFDVMGRLVSTQYVNGVETVEKPSQTGVYVFRLNEKAQKIVIR